MKLIEIKKELEENKHFENVKRFLLTSRERTMPFSELEDLLDKLPGSGQTAQPIKISLFYPADDSEDPKHPERRKINIYGRSRLFGDWEAMIIIDTEENKDGRGRYFKLPVISVERKQ